MKRCGTPCSVPQMLDFTATPRHALSGGGVHLGSRRLDFVAWLSRLNIRKVETSFCILAMQDW
mgnify:CR=1 FL=1